MWILLIGLGIIIFAVYTVHEPYLIKNNVNGDWLLWYNSNEKHKSRKYINLTKIWQTKN